MHDSPLAGGKIEQPQIVRAVARPSRRRHRRRKPVRIAPANRCQHCSSSKHASEHSRMLCYALLCTCSLRSAALHEARMKWSVNLAIK